MDLVSWLQKQLTLEKKGLFMLNTSMGESNTILSAYTLYRHLEQCCSHPSTCIIVKYKPFPKQSIQFPSKCKEFTDNIFKYDENDEKFSK